MAGEVIFHIPEHIRRNFSRRTKKHFYKRLWNDLTACGVGVRILNYEDRHYRRIDPGDGNLHFVNNGNLSHPNVLNTAIAYLDRFWQVDAQGVLCDSSISDQTFDPKRIDGAQSWAFFQTLRRDYADARQSRYHQPKDVAQITPGAIAVFLQGDSHLTDRARRWSTPQMIRSVAKGAGGRPIVVKPHPLKVAPEDILAVHDLAASGVDISLSEANVHDILTHASATVSIGSACSFEGFLHKKPAILYGRSDFHHFAENITDLGDFAAAYDQAMTRKRGYSRYVYWFLHERCIWTLGRDFFAKVSDRMVAQGFDPVVVGARTVSSAAP